MRSGPAHPPPARAWWRRRPRVADCPLAGVSGRELYPAGSSCRQPPPFDSSRLFRCLVDPFRRPDHRRADVLDVVDPDAAVDGAAGHPTQAISDDVEHAFRPDLLAEGVLEREPDLVPDFGVSVAVVLAQEIRRDHGLGPGPCGGVVGRHERREVVGARQVVLIGMITDMRLLLPEERSVAIAELAVRVLLGIRPDRLCRDARPVLLAVEEAAQKEVVPGDEPVEGPLGRLAVLLAPRHG